MERVCVALCTIAELLSLGCTVFAAAAARSRPPRRPPRRLRLRDVLPHQLHCSSLIAAQQLAALVQELRSCLRVSVVIALALDWGRP